MIHLIRDVGDALAHAHAQGVLHRDVKPSNVLIGVDQRPRLLDFGLARTDDSQDLTRSTSHLGSLPYMAPEQVAGEAGTQSASLDVYALGVTMYECLTLRSPFLGASAEATRANILAALPRAPRAINSAVSVDLETVCLTAMDRSPARRYPSMVAFLVDLDNLIEHRPIQARPAGRLLRGRRWCQRHPALAVGLGMAVLVFTMVLGFTFHLLERNQLTQETNYSLGVGAAKSQLDQVRTRAAIASLEMCPEALRRFEWRHLKLRSDSSDVVYVGHDQRVGWLAMHPSGEEFISTSGGSLGFWTVARPPQRRLVEVASGR